MGPPPVRFIALALGLIIGALLLRRTHHLPALEFLAPTPPAPAPEKFLHASADAPWAQRPAGADPAYNARGGRENATLLMLARNSDVAGAVQSVRSLEDRFNARYNYPWVFLNEEPFSEEFKRRVGVLTSAPVTFGLIPREHWVQPAWVDEPRASASRAAMEAAGVIYGGSLSYRNMCRFNAGFFFRHALLQQYAYYWRVEPGVAFHCDVGASPASPDPFVTMREGNKVYGFTIALYEYASTIPSLWATAVDFVRKHPHFLAPASALAFLSDDQGATYNLCHFWSNFEIASLDFFRSPAYTQYFDFLDEAGGFYYERWGDAPVHSIGAALFANASQVQFFEGVGYEHPPFAHCPVREAVWRAGRCGCEPKESFDLAAYSCLDKWRAVAGVGRE
ncbi:hypothetical protein HWV62_35837 [Athelia sp. TMB]|nr:hypothetical protein HWV62_35837 [Athelia sp. TMB]